MIKSRFFLKKCSDISYLTYFKKCDFFLNNFKNNFMKIYFHNYKNVKANNII